MREWNYTHRINRRAKSTILTIHPDGRIVVTTPRKVSVEVVEQFLKTKSVWIEKTFTKFEDGRQKEISGPKKFSVAESKGYRDHARTLALSRLTYFNQFYGFQYSRVTMRNQKTRWGSCSKRGTLSFNFRIALLPSHLADYIIVHELCHLKEMNHSERFWKLVTKTVPDYKACRSELRKEYRI